MTIFFVLNGAAFIFLLYVLVKFWQEGRRSKADSRLSARKALTVIPFPMADRRTNEPLPRQVVSRSHREIPAIRISTR